MLAGGLLHARGLATVGQVTTVALYMRQLVDPLDVVLSWLDHLQVGATSFARLLGVAHVPADREATGRQPADERLVARGVRFAYTPGHDVLHGVDLDLRPGERLTMVGPSGAGKSTLGRLLAGVNAPRSGSVAVGGVGLVELPLDQLRGHVVLVTQEQHVFAGTLRDNLSLARAGATDTELRSALGAVDALGWVDALPDGLDTTVGAGAHPLSAAEAQQVALARLVLADPHTLVLDEATSLLDPSAARHLERSLSAVLAGRTVVAIAHRLHTAQHADRVAVVSDGRITELGTHADLVAADGPYAALWHRWRNEPASTRRWAAAGYPFTSSSCSDQLKVGNPGLPPASTTMARPTPSTGPSCSRAWSGSVVPDQVLPCPLPVPLTVTSPWTSRKRYSTSSMGNANRCGPVTLVMPSGSWNARRSNCDAPIFPPYAQVVWPCGSCHGGGTPSSCRRACAAAMRLPLRS